MKPFRFKEFSVSQDKTAMKIGTDAVLLGAWASIDAYPDTILDVGSGTGVISLMLAQRSNAMTIDAVEIEENAYEQTVENFELSDWGDRLFYEFETNDEARNKARFTSALSFEDLLTGVVTILAEKGNFTTIIPFKEEEAFVALAKERGLFLNAVCHVKGTATSDIKRSLMSFSFEEKELVKEELIIEIARHQYTDAYINLTKDFYLKM